MPVSKYQAKVTEVDALEILTPPKRLNMTSLVYTYEEDNGIKVILSAEFTSAARPSVGDFLVKVGTSWKHHTALDFGKQYGQKT